MPSAVPKPKKITMLQVYKSDPEDNKKTQGLKRNNGLGKEDIIKNKRGKIVSKEASERSAANYQGSDMQRWTKCCSQACKDLGIKGADRFTQMAAGMPGYDRAYDYYDGTRAMPFGWA